MAPQTLSLTYGTAEDYKGILLVATYCGLHDQVVDAQASEGLRLKTADGHELQSFNSICRHLASCSPKSKQLLGDTHTDRALVCQGYCESQQAERARRTALTCDIMTRSRIGFHSETQSYQACWRLRCCRQDASLSVGVAKACSLLQQAFLWFRLTNDYRPRCSLLECLSVWQIW